MKIYKTCQIEDILVVSEESDFTLKHLLSDPRTKVLSSEQVRNPAWVGNSVNVHDAYIKTRGLDAIALASLHYWENGIDFDYIDVGANTGFVVCVEAIFHKKCGHFVLSHAFEPGDVFEALKRTVAANGLSANIICNDAAILDRSGVATLYNTNEHTEASSLRSSAVRRFPITDITEKIVKTVRLDDYEKIRDVPGVITKIDTEGADFIALNGMSKLLSDRLCTVQLEFTPSLISEYEDPVRRLYELSKDFLILEVSSNHRLPVLTDIDWITDFVSAVGRRQSSVTDIMIISKKVPKAIDLFSRILVG